MQIGLQHLEWLSIYIVHDNGITDPVEKDIVHGYRISTV